MIDLTTREPATHATWRSFRTYWFGYFVSMVGDSFTLVALPVAAFAVGGSSILVGFVDMMEILSGVLFGTVLGVVADRYDSRFIMWTSDLVRVTLLLALAVIAYTGNWNATALLVIAVGLGLLRALHDGAESAMLARIIPAEREMQAFARLSAADSTGRMVGPFLGGLALEVGLWVAFGIDAATFAIAALAVLLIPRADGQRPHESPGAGRPGLRAEFGAAMTEMRARPTYLVLVGVGAFGNLAGLTMAGLFVPFAEEVLELESVGLGFGLLLALMGLGGLAADWYVNRQTTHDPRTAGLAMAVVAASVILAGALPSLATSVLAMMTTGAGFAYYQTNYSAYRQEIFPPEMLGRVSMATRTLFYVTMIVGFSTAGIISDALGADVMFMIFGGVSLAGILVVGFIPLDVDPETGATI